MASAHRQELQHSVFFAAERHGLARNFGLLGLRLHGEIAAMKGRFGMTHRPTDDRVDARDGLVFVEGLRDVATCLMKALVDADFLSTSDIIECDDPTAPARE
jgi:hypothetical protein